MSFDPTFSLVLLGMFCMMNACFAIFMWYTIQQYKKELHDRLLNAEESCKANFALGEKLAATLNTEHQRVSKIQDLVQQVTLKLS